MQPIEQALKDVHELHEQVTRQPAPEIGPHAFLPFPPGVDPVAYAVEEVQRLKQILEQRAGGTPQPSWIPRAAVFGSERALVVSVELPGIPRDEVSLTVTAGELLVRGERPRPDVGAEMQPMLVEQTWGPFERRFPLPAWCNPERISAQLAEGVLTVSLERYAESTPSEVEIEIG